MLNNIYISIVLMFVTTSQFVSSEQNPIIFEEVVSPNWDNFDCHGSSIIETSPGSLCLVWKGGPGEGKSNIDIKENVGVWLSRFQNGGWIAPEQIVEAPSTVVWTPALAKLPSGKLLLFYRVGVESRHSIAFSKYSLDEGATWSQEEALPAGIKGPVRAKPVIDQDGNMICGSCMESGSPEEQFAASSCWIDIFSQRDNTWKKYGPIEIPEKRFGAGEPSLFYDGDGNLRIVCRDRSRRIGEIGWILTAKSEDDGKSWSSLEKTSLPNPDSGVDTVSLGDGKILMVYNHSHQDRFPLNVALSVDGGDSWNPVYTLENDSGEFPSIEMTSDGLVHITYAWVPNPNVCQRRIKHVVMDATKLRN